MKSILKLGFSTVTICLFLLALAGCSQIDQPIPVVQTDTTSKKFPVIMVILSGFEDSVDIDFSQIIEANEPFSLNFSSFRHGQIVLRKGNKFRYISQSEEMWVTDSGFYDYCKGGNCRRGVINIKNDRRSTNAVFVLPDLGPFYLLYLGSLDPYLIPTGRTGKIKQATHNFFTSQIVGPDSAKVLYYAGSGPITPFLMGFDDVTYKIKTAGDTIFTGQFSLVLGDTCGAQARSDSYTITDNEVEWTSLDWAANDEPCFAPLENFTIKIQPTAYNNSLTINTGTGILTDTLINGAQKLLYKRTNLNATQDIFPYYLLSHSDNRLSRAWIKLKFNQ